MRNPVGEHARLARPGPGEDEQRPLPVQNGFALGLVQPLKQGIGGHSTHPFEDRGGSGRLPRSRRAEGARAPAASRGGEGRGQTPTPPPPPRAPPHGPRLSVTPPMAPPAGGPPRRP